MYADVHVKIQTVTQQYSVNVTTGLFKNNAIFRFSISIKRESPKVKLL